MVVYEIFFFHDDFVNSLNHLRRTDVFLWPLVDELKMLWVEGVQMRDVSTHTVFTMCAILLWTINDYHVHISLSGWNNQGYKVCATCNEDTPSCFVTSKIAYVGHKRFLHRKHKWRENLFFNDKKRVKKAYQMI